MKTIRPSSAGVFPRVENGVHDVALGNGTQHRVLVHDNAFGIIGHGCYQFNINAHANYVCAKLRLGDYFGDAAVLADFINDQLFEPGSIPRQGEVHEAYCERVTISNDK